MCTRWLRYCFVLFIVATTPLLFSFLGYVGLTGCAGPATSSTSFPETCTEVQEAAVDETGVNPEDGTYTLYVNGDESLPWEAYCYDMNRSEPIEFLAVNEANNYSQIGNGQELVETTYRRIRIDPISLELYPLDDTFTDTSDADEFVPVFPIGGMESVPLGWAEFQPPAFNMDPGVEAMVDLTDTPFVLNESILNNPDDFFCNVTNPSYDENSGVGSGYEIANDLTSFTLTATNTNSLMMEDASTREVADCANLGPDADLDALEVDSASIPLEYVGL